ncbi:hypothetical protein ANN_20595 [Periplaneta americana]|uniref:Uncharacterized protein n=1 Tax=Periplaneta americana TaxID=6978 RepID=A0ABQ8SDU5_PERAM|nr:hypothetical protein ANN_20595 [Periplaneta americana]
MAGLCEGNEPPGSIKATLLPDSSTLTYSINSWLNCLISDALLVSLVRFKPVLVQLTKQQQTSVISRIHEALDFHADNPVSNPGADKSKEIAYKSLVRKVMGYGAACWDPYRLEHIKTLEKIKKRALKRCNNSTLTWDTLTDRRTRIRLCVMLKTYRGEPAWREMKNRLQTPNYSSWNDHSYKLKERRQLADEDSICNIVMS